MPARLADRLNQARRRRFVGREAERELVASAFAADELPFCVLHVFGPGGVGKTTLLSEFGRIAEESGATPIRIDARYIEPMPEAFVEALRGALSLPGDVDPWDALAERPQRQMVLIDTYESLAQLDGWLREVFLPQMPENTLIVLAGRHPPAAAWRSDAGWQSLVRVMPLRNLSPRESRIYLAAQQIPAEKIAAVLDFTHGHPLALSLVAEVVAQSGHRTFQPDAAPDVVKTLLERFIADVPGPQHRRALEACAMLRLTTEALLAEVLGVEDAHDLFEWLRGLSFIESTRLGLFPHDLARDSLITDLRWRNPDWYRELHARARVYYLDRVQRSHGQEQQSILFDYIFLHRDNAVVRPFYEWENPGAVLTDTLRPGEAPALVEMVRAHEGEASAAIAERWLTRRPESVYVFRDASPEPVGFIMLVPLQQVEDEERAFDPGTDAALRYLQAHAPLRPGERATLFRFWMGRETYQTVSVTQSVAFVNAVRHYLGTPGLAYTIFPCSDPDFWAPVFAYADLARIPEADFEVGGKRYGAYGHDWRTVPPAAWLAVMAEREMGLPADAGVAPTAPDPVVVLSRQEFTSAVKDALRDLLRPEALRQNPLVRSRLVVERATPDADAATRAGTLRGLIEDTVTALQRTPRDAKLFRALDKTYVHPAPTQEQAAEALDLPFSTFRRHLTAGIAAVVEGLWAQEIHDSEQ